MWKRSDTFLDRNGNVMLFKKNDQIANWTKQNKLTLIKTNVVK